MATGIGGEALWWCPSLDDAGNGTGTVTGFAGVDGTIVGGSWLADTDNGGVRCIQMDSGDYVQIAGALTGFGGADLSVSSWIRKETWFDTELLFAFYESGGSFDGWGIRSQNTNLGRLQFLQAGSIWKATNILATSGAWHHIAFVLNVSTFDYWLDGVKYTPATPGANNSYTGNDRRLGQTTVGGRPAADWRFDDFRAFERLLTDEEIANLASMRGYEPAGPTAEYKPGLYNTSALVLAPDRNPF